MKKATLEQYHRAIVHIWVELTAVRPRPVSLTEICKMHGVSVNLPAVMRREGVITGSRRQPRWAFTLVPDGPGACHLSCRLRGLTLSSMRGHKPKPAPAPVPATAAEPAPGAAPLQLALDPDADLREQVAALASMVQTLVERQGVAA